MKNLRILHGVVGEQFALERLYESEAVISDLLYEFMPRHRFSAENRYSPAGHTLESLRVRYYSDKEYEVILGGTETDSLTSGVADDQEDRS